MDAANLVRLAIEIAPASSVLHATAEHGVPTRVIAEAIGRGLDLPVVSVPAEQALDHFTGSADSSVPTPRPPTR